MNSLPHPFYYYGSHDSLDEDVIISIPKELMPEHQEERKNLMLKIKNDYSLSFNATLAVIEDGLIVDTIYPKTWIDSLNNALFFTYKNHLEKQQYNNPIQKRVERNILLSIYRSVRTILSMLTRTHYRSEIKPIIKGCHDFKLKLEALKKIDFHTIHSFDQKNTQDIDIWKTIAFYIGQNISLITEQVEIYTKSDLVKHHPQLIDFIYRKPLDKVAISTLNQYLKTYSNLLESYGEYQCNDIIMTCKNERIDMRNEVF